MANRYSQPQGATKLNCSNPITKTILGAWDIHGASLIPSGIGSLTLTGSTNKVAQKGIVFDLAGSGYLTNTAQSAVTTVPFSLVILVNIRSASTNRVFDVSTGTTASHVIGIQIGSSGSQIIAQHYDGLTNATAVASLTGKLNKWISVCAVFESLSSRSIYIDGVLVSTDTTTVSAPSGINRATIGYAPWSNAEFFDGQILSPLIFGKALSAAEIKSLSDNPWQIFKPAAQLFKAASGGGGTTITCIVGDAAGSGVSALVSTAITATVGNASANGITANVGSTIVSSVGNASANGINSLENISIVCGVGNSSALGVNASLGGPVTIAGTVGDASALGVTAVVNDANIITGSVGNVSAVGVTASVNDATVIQTNTGNAAATGINASIGGPLTISCSIGYCAALGINSSVSFDSPNQKQGGDDAPRYEIYSKRQKPKKKNDEDLTTIIRQAYDKATGKTPVSETNPEIEAKEWIAEQVAIVKSFDFDDEEEELLMLLI